MQGLLLRQSRCQLLAQGLLLGRLLTQQLGQVRLMLLLLRGQRLRCGVLQGLGVLALHLRQALLMFAPRREHLARVIDPALARGDWVVCDRFTDATYAYQGGGRGLDRHKFNDLEHWVHGHLQPDLTLLFDLPFAVARERIALQTRELDRFEQEKADFHERVRQAYLERAAASPQRMRVIDANQSLESIKKLVEDYLITIC